jgi:hypothetical protein
MIVQNALEVNKINRSKSKFVSSPPRTSSGEGTGVIFDSWRSSFSGTKHGEKVAGLGCSNILWRLVGQGFQFALLSLDVSGPIR